MATDCYWIDIPDGFLEEEGTNSSWRYAAGTTDPVFDQAKKAPGRPGKEMKQIIFSCRLSFHDSTGENHSPSL
jgi:hypothetical protein